MNPAGYEHEIAGLAIVAFLSIPIIIMVITWVCDTNMDFKEFVNRCLWRHKVLVEESYPDGFLTYVFYENIFGMRRHKKTYM